MVVGRLPTCELPLDAEGVSRRHARFIVEAGVVEVEDLGSRNGTLLNGNAVARRVVRDGDVLTFGRVDATFRESSTAVGTSADDPFTTEELFAETEPRAASGGVAPEVIEFVDEVVPVDTRAVTPAPGPRAAPRPVIEPRRAAPKAKKREGGILAEDVGQLGGLPKLLLVLACLAFAGLVGWLAMTLASG